MSESSIKRLVYTPKAYVFIYSRKEGGVVDVSNDVVGGSVQRLINQPSKAKVTLRNDNWQYTGRFNPMFYPMDGITIWLQKFARKPVQVFTGYIDSIPFYQAYPDKIEIAATCTLKRALYSYFDPGVGFYEWLGEHGWFQNAGGNAFFSQSMMASESTLAPGEQGSADSGMGQLLHDFLIDIGGWDPKSIIIGDLPNALPKSMMSAYVKRAKASAAAEKVLLPTLKRFLTIQAEQGTDAAVQDLANVPSGISTAAKIGDVKRLTGTIDKFLKSTSKPNMEQMILAAIVMSGLDKDFEGTDPKYPSYGRGYFAEQGPTGRTATTQTDYYTAEAAGTRFCQKFSELVAADTTVASGFGFMAVLTDDKIMQVSEVLAYGYGRDKFYGQILEACRKSENIQAANTIANAIRQNQNLENLSTLGAISAAQVTETQLPSAITWEKIFAISGNEPKDVQVVDKDGKTNGVAVDPSVSAPYKTSFMTYLPANDTVADLDFPKVGGTSLKHTEVKYYIYGVGSGLSGSGSSRRVAGRLSGTYLKSGARVKLTSPSGDKTVTCVFIGNIMVTSPNAALTVSPDAISALGINKRTNGSVTTDVTFEIQSDPIPTVPTTTGLSEQDQKNEYVRSIAKVLGSNPGGSDTYAGVNITSADKDIYQKYYKSANNRLAEYFFIASSYGLHLMDKLPGTDQLLLYGNENGSAEQMISFLQDIGILSPSASISQLTPNAVAQSVPRGMRVSVNTGQMVTRFDFDGADVRTTAEPFDAGVIQSGNPYTTALATASINANTGNPSPIWNGSVARLPDTLGDDSPNAPGGDLTQLTWADMARFSTASAFTTLTAFPFDMVGSALLVGEQSLMNDEPVIRGVEELCKGSMRHYMSLPNGQFCAFYPDFFGVFGRKPYLKIKDIEIVDLSIVINDEPIVTHMYVNGNTINPFDSGVDIQDKILSVGVITIDDVFKGNKGLNFINNPSAVTGGDADGPTNFDLENEATPAVFSQYYDGIDPKSVKFLETYGARPKVVNEPLIKSPWFEFVAAYNQFTYQWTMHTATNVELTFMPELMAGGLVQLEDQNIVMYVEAVNHAWNYATGFETSAYLTAPSTDPNREDVPTVPGMAIFRSVVGDEL